MASSKKRKPSSTTASRAKKPVRFVKSSSASKSSTKKATTGSKRTKRASTAKNSAKATNSRAASRKSSTRTSAVASKTSSARKSTTARKASTSRKATSRRAVASSAALGKDSGDLPGWRELADNNASRQTQRPESETWLGAISTARFVVIVLAVATVFTLYVGHVFATQDLLAEVQGMRNEQLALQMTFDKLEGEYHRVTGPEHVFDAARDLGLEDRLLEGEPVLLR